MSHKAQFMKLEISINAVRQFMTSPTSLSLLGKSRKAIHDFDKVEIIIA